MPTWTNLRCIPRRRFKFWVIIIFILLVLFLLWVNRQQPQESNVEEKPDVEKDVKEEDNENGHKMALLVPFRNRFEELLEFAPYMHQFLKKHGTDHQIYVLNQVDNYRFNRAALINVGFLESRSDCDYIAMHDVDLVPVNPKIQYPYPQTGVYHVASPQLHPLYHYSKFVGGILLLTRAAFISTDGMSNRYWGWGREDDEFFVRMRKQALRIERPLGINTGYKTFRHIHDRKKHPRDNKRYFNQTRETSRLDRKTGASNVKYTVSSRHEIVIDGAPVTLLNIELDCDIKSTPWCLKEENHNLVHV